MTFANDDDDVDVYRLTGTLASGETVMLLRNATRQMAEQVALYLSRRTAFHDLRVELDIPEIAIRESLAPILAIPR
jgi:hypothetical protein